MRRRATEVVAVATLAAVPTGCVSPTVSAPSDTEALVCTTATSPGLGPTTQLGVAATPSGAVLAWVPTGGGAVMTEPLNLALQATAAPSMAWPGSYDAAFASAVDDQVIVSAVAGDDSWILSAPFGIAPYRELGILGGVSGASPMLMANSDRVAATVSYGGLLVNGFDASWAVHTSELAVLTPNAQEVAAASLDDEAVVVWPTSDACYIERVLGVATGMGWSEPGACNAPRVASIGSDVAITFERGGNVYFQQAAPSALHPAKAEWLALGSQPRVVAIDGAYWLSFVDPSGAIVAGVVDADGTLHSTAVAAADAYELAVVGGKPWVIAASSAGVVASGLCTQ